MPRTSRRNQWRTEMFKSLIAAIALACAAVASVSAHADTSLPFVDPLIGSWCSVVGYGFNNKNATFKRGPVLAT